MPKRGKSRRMGQQKAHKTALRRVPVLKKQEIIRVPVLAKDIEPKKQKLLTEFGGVWRLKLTKEQNLALDWLFKKYGEKGGGIFGQPTLDAEKPEFKMCVFPPTNARAILLSVNQEREKLKIAEEI
jgi:hypothetical protein